MEIVSDSNGVRSTVIIRACKIKYHTNQGICYTCVREVMSLIFADVECVHSRQAAKSLEHNGNRTRDFWFASPMQTTRSSRFSREVFLKPI